MIGVGYWKPAWTYRWLPYRPGPICYGHRHTPSSFYCNLCERFI